MERPRIKIRLTALDYIIEATAFLFALGAIVLYIIYWIKAPDVVPIHYNIYGEVDSSGSKPALLFLLIITVVFCIGLTILNKYPHIFNFPNAVTAQNALSLYKIATRLVRWLKLWICLLFAYMIWYLIMITIHPKYDFLNLLLWLFLASLMFTLIFYIVKMVKKSEEIEKKVKKTLNVQNNLE